MKAMEDNLGSLSMLIQNVTIGSRSLESEYDKIQRTNYYTGYEDATDLSMTVIESKNFGWTNWLDEWEKSFINENGTFKSNVNPKKLFKLTLYDFNYSNFNAGDIFSRLNPTSRDLKLEMTQEFTIEGASYISRSDLDLTYEADGFYTFDIELKVDSIKREQANTFSVF